MNIYFARPITGLDYETVANSYEDTKDVLQGYGYGHVYHAFCAKGHLKNETCFKADRYEDPLTCNHAITLRDRWMVLQSDVLYLNIVGATRVSIGSIMELAWAFDHGKHCVVAMEKDNPHRHAFVLEAAHVVFETDSEALDYLKKLVVNEL